jgi:Chaperone of endosialidase
MFVNRSLGAVGRLMAFVCFATLCGASQAQAVGNRLLTIDQNRAAIVDRIVLDHAAGLTQAGIGITPEDLRSMLMQLRADQLQAASWVATSNALRDVLGRALVGDAPVNPALLQTVEPVSSRGSPAKAIGDGTDDVVYTPVTPCRLVETRGTFAAVYQGDGTPAHTAVPFNVNEVRTYTVETGNSVCASQLPSGLDPVAVQLQVFGMPTTGASGDIEILPQGATFGSTATEVFIGSIAFNTVSTTAKINTSNNQISVKVTGGKANLAMDVVGYFKVSGSYGGTQTITGQYATIAGGYQQTASGIYSAVLGGYENQATKDAASVVGGMYNYATGGNSTVLGGYENQASGGYSTTVGGYQNQASGDYSLATGSDAQALFDGEFVWSDNSTTVPFEPSSTGSAPNGWTDASRTFNVRATHGVWFVTGIDSNGHPSAGTYLSNGGSAWQITSDRASKENFRDVDHDEVLRKVAAMPITSWNYISEGPDVRHMGPVAQDFRGAFGLGTNDKTLTSIDESGVAFAAIKALYGEIQRRNDEIRALARRVEDLEARHAPIVAPLP